MAERSPQKEGKDGRMAFSQSFLNELVAKNDIVSVVSSYVDLKPKGRRLWGLCPLHGEKTPSFSVSPDKQAFYCFGCHAGGSVVQFVMEMERLTFPEAVRFLADRAGMAMPEEVDDARMRMDRAKRDRLYEACRLAARYYMENLLGPEGGPGRAYLKQRGLTGDAVKRFGLGYALDGWDHLEKHLTEKGFSQGELVEAGLLTQNAQSGRVYDAYRNRLMFPIVGANGRVLGFGARVLDDSKPKYINTGDTPIYNKRNNLYGLNLQKGAKIADLVMVEGYTDVIGLYQAGVSNVVASLGTALTLQQARLIKRYTETVYIAYDGDAAGQNATIRGLDILSGEGLNLRVIVFPDGQDPDEFIRTQGKEAFDALKDGALTLNAFKLERMADGYDLSNENQREQYAIQACRLIGSLQPLEQARYYRQLAQKTGYAEEALKAQGGQSKPLLEPSLHRSTPGWKNNQNTEKQRENQRFRAETAMLAAILACREAAEAAVAEGGLELLDAKPYKQLANAIVAAYAVDAEPNVAAVIAGMEPQEAAVAGAVLKEDVELIEPLQAVRDCIRRIRRYDIENRIQELTQSLSDPKMTKEEKTACLTKIQALNREIRGA